MYTPERKKTRSARRLGCCENLSIQRIIDCMNTYPETVFDKIISGEIPCHKVYEDDMVLAFLDIGPLSPGHTLVIPKERAQFLHQLSEASAAAIGRVLPRLARAVMIATGATSYNILQNNGTAAHQAVFHVHFHIIPKTETGGLELGWKTLSLNPDDAEKLSLAIREEITEK